MEAASGSASDRRAKRVILGIVSAVSRGGLNTGGLKCEDKVEKSVVDLMWMFESYEFVDCRRRWSIERKVAMTEKLEHNKGSG